MTELLASILGASALGVAFTLALFLRSALNDRNAQADRARDAERQADGYRTERDLAVTARAATAAERAGALARLAHDDQQRNDALTKEATDAHDTILAAADPADALNRMLLGSDAPARTAGPAAGDGRGAADAVLVAPQADGPGAGSGHGG